jgi:hypothetical protein
MKKTITAFLLLMLLPIYVFAQYSQTIRLNYLEPARVQKGLHKVIAKSQEVYGVGVSGGGGDYYSGSISQGTGNGLSWRNITVDLLSVERDTTNPSARLYIYSPQRDREITLSKNNSELFDNFRIRLDGVDQRQNTADITIRQVGGSIDTIPASGLHPPGRVNVQIDTRNSSVTITADYQIDLKNLVDWVHYWDQPATLEKLNQRAAQKGTGEPGKALSEGTMTYDDLDKLNKNYKDYDELKTQYENKKITFQEFERKSRILELQRKEFMDKCYPAIE